MKKKFSAAEIPSEKDHYESSLCQSEESLTGDCIECEDCDIEIIPMEEFNAHPERYNPDDYFTITHEELMRLKRFVKIAFGPEDGK